MHKLPFVCRKIIVYIDQFVKQFANFLPNSHLKWPGFCDIPLTCYILCGTMYPLEARHMNVDEWRSQIKRGTLEFCILLLIDKKPRYGYELISTLERSPIVATKESTIYPLLRRLQKDGCLTASWQETAEGLPPRKYYALTDAGREYLAAMRREWADLRAAIEDLEGDEGNE